MNCDIYFKIQKYLDGNMSSIEEDEFLLEVKLNDELKEGIKLELQLLQLKLTPNFISVDNKSGSEFRELAEKTFKDWQEKKVTEAIKNALNEDEILNVLDSEDIRQNTVLTYIPRILVLVFIILLFVVNKPKERISFYESNNLTRKEKINANDSQWGIVPKIKFKKPEVSAPDVTRIALDSISVYSNNNANKDLESLITPVASSRHSDKQYINNYLPNACDDTASIYNEIAIHYSTANKGNKFSGDFNGDNTNKIPFFSGHRVSDYKEPEGLTPWDSLPITADGAGRSDIKKTKQNKSKLSSVNYDWMGNGVASCGEISLSNREWYVGDFNGDGKNDIFRCPNNDFFAQIGTIYKGKSNRMKDVEYYERGLTISQDYFSKKYQDTIINTIIDSLGEAYRFHSHDYPKNQKVLWSNNDALANGVTHDANAWYITILGTEYVGRPSDDWKIILIPSGWGIVNPSLNSLGLSLTKSRVVEPIYYGYAGDLDHYKHSSDKDYLVVSVTADNKPAATNVSQDSLGLWDYEKDDLDNKLAVESLAKSDTRSSSGDEYAQYFEKGVKTAKFNYDVVSYFKGFLWHKWTVISYSDGYCIFNNVKNYRTIDDIINTAMGKGGDCDWWLYAEDFTNVCLRNKNDALLLVKKHGKIKSIRFIDHPTKNCGY